MNRHWMMEVLDGLLGYKKREEALKAIWTYELKARERRIARNPELTAKLDKVDSLLERLNSVAKFHDNLLDVLREFERIQNEEDIEAFLAMWPASQVEEARRQGLLPSSDGEEA